jgi:hypothetical protein
MSEVVESTPEAVVGVPTPIAESTPAVEAPATPEVKTSETEAKTDEQPEKRGESRFQRRLNKAYRRAAEFEAKAKVLEERLAKLEQPQAALDGAAPRLEQFDDIEKFAAAREKYAAEKAINDYEAKQRESQQKAQITKLASAWDEKAERGVSKYDDFDDVVGELKPTNPLLVAIMRAENGEDIAYHLGKNPKEAMRLAGLEPIEQILAVGTLGAKLASEPPKAKQPSKAPPPIAPVTGARPTPSEAHDPNDDMRTFIKKRNRELGRVALK